MKKCSINQDEPNKADKKCCLACCRMIYTKYAMIMNGNINLIYNDLQ